MKQRLKKYFKSIDALLLPKCRDQEGLLPYIMLGYLSFYFFPLFSSKLTADVLIIAALSLIMFLVVYFHLFWVKPRRRVLHVVLMWLLGIGLFPIYFGGMSFIIYAAAMGCLLGSIRRSIIVVLAVALATSVVSYLYSQSIAPIMPTLFLIFMVGSLNIYFVDLERKKVALKLSHQEVREMAKIAERERIARDLHDRIGHTFSIITLKAELAKKLLDQDIDAARRELAELETLSRDTLAQVRDVVSDYRKSSLQVEMLNARLALETAGIKFDFSMGPEALPEKLDTQLSNILREGVTNIIRHSNATYCEVSLIKNAQGFHLEILDDGNAKSYKEGNGLKGMRERAQSLGGQFNISTGNATRLSILIPV